MSTLHVNQLKQILKSTEKTKQKYDHYPLHISSTEKNLSFLTYNNINDQLVFQQRQKK